MQHERCTEQQVAKSRGLALEAHASSVGQARQFVRMVLSDWGMTAVLDEAQLLTSELVTNALLHTPGGGVDVQVRQLADGVRIEVSDLSAALPRVRRYSASSGTGRGMALVATWSRAWGTEPRPPGKIVWFELATRAS